MIIYMNQIVYINNLLYGLMIDHTFIRVIDSLTAKATIF